MIEPDKLPTPDIHRPAFVRDLFNRMSRTYGLTNYLSSFGFSEIWRRACIRQIDWDALTAGAHTYDLMSGMGECWNLIMQESATRVTGVDISEEMNQKAAARKYLKPDNLSGPLRENVLDSSLPSASAEVIVSAFGLKHFSDNQLQTLAGQINRLLKAGGQLSFVEISVPGGLWIRLPFMFYLERVVPLIGKYFANDDFSYRYLGVYTRKFGNAKRFTEFLAAEGLKVEYRTFFFGCASGVYGQK